MHDPLGDPSLARPRSATPDSAPPPASCASAAQRGQRVRSEMLLAGAREVVIEHRGQEYLLRLTASGKLILTK